MGGRHFKAIALATVMGFGVAACGGGDEADVEADADVPAMGEVEQPAAGPTPPANLPEGVTAEQWAMGQQLFVGQGICHTCHGRNAEGTQLAPNLTDAEWINVSGPNYQEIVDLIHTGVPQPVEHPAPMPPMGGASLTEEQVEALAAYVVTLGQG